MKKSIFRRTGAGLSALLLLFSLLFSSLFSGESYATGQTDGSFEARLTQQGFPESYKVKLRELHKKYPEWVFTAMHTNLEWSDVIYNQSLVGRNLVHRNSISSWKSLATGAYDWSTGTWPGFDTSAWVAASEDIIKYYVDPRNFLDEQFIFQFLHQGYNAQLHTASGVETLAKSTFLESRAIGQVISGSLTTAGVSQNSSGDVRLSTAPAGGSGDARLEAPVNGDGSHSDIVVADPNAPVHNPAPNSPSSQAALQMPPGEGAHQAAASVSILQPGQEKGPGVAPAGPSGEGGASASGATEENQGIRYQTEGEKTYVDIIMTAAAASGVSPYVLTAMIIQEQGVKGSSGLISGTTPPYEGIYNFFNVEAYQEGELTPTQRGLRWASREGSYGRPWNTKEKAIVGGATYYGNTYLRAGQDTFYLKKFNVQGTNLYKHQYMTFVEGAAYEGSKLGRAYSAELKKTALEFKIPVYKNMPADPVPKPTGDGSPNNKLSALSVTGCNMTPTFSRDTESYDIIIGTDVGSLQIQASAIDSKASVSGIGSVPLSPDQKMIQITVKAENGVERIYKINIARQEGAPAGGSQPSNSAGSQETEGTGQGSDASRGPGAGVGSDVHLVAPGN